MAKKEDRLTRQGEARRDEGVARGAAASPGRIRAARFALLEAMLRSPNGEATLDDATTGKQLTHAFPCGGKWRGSVTLSLKKDGMIEHTGRYRLTVRPAGHRRPNAVWRLTDHNATRRYLRLARVGKAGTEEGGKP